MDVSVLLFYRDGNMIMRMMIIIMSIYWGNIYLRMDNAQGTMQVDDDVVVVIPILIIMELIIIAMERICVTYLRTIFA